MKKQKMIVYADSSCNILYSSFYLYGLQKRYGCRIKFTSKYFKHLEHYHQFLALVVKDGSKSKNVVIDHSDRSFIRAGALEWSDIYAKLNLEEKDRNIDQILAIGPMFTINLFSLPQTIWHAIVNYLRSINRIHDIKKFFSFYRAQLNRPKYSVYQPASSSENYIFFISSLWKDEIEINNLRSTFISSCKKNDRVVFEGGFAPRSKNDISGYEQNTLPSRIPHPDFLEKTKKSALAFNTPGVALTNGWRTAEYLSLGKAILSSQLHGVMPGNFKADKHMVFTDGTEEDITKKVNQILSNQTLKTNLEKNALAYFQKYLAPEAVVERIIEAAGF